jgi:hypothetical protein
MPNTSFELEVATEKPKAIVYANEYIKKPLAKLLRQKGLSVSSSGSGDYIIDLQGNPQAIQTAQEQGTKYLRLLIGPQAKPDLSQLNNWRLVRTNYLIGEHTPENTFLANTIKQAIYNQQLEFPCPADHLLYPIALRDLVHGLWQALVLPSTNQKEFLILGSKVKAKELAEYLENLGQTTQGISFQKTSQLPTYDQDLINQSRQSLKWQPKKNWQEAVKDGFQALWQKLEPEEQTPAPPRPKETEPLEEEEKQFAQEDEKTIPENELAPPEQKPQLPDFGEQDEDEEELIVVDQEPKIKDILSQFDQPEPEPQPKKENKVKKQTREKPVQEIKDSQPKKSSWNWKQSAFLLFLFIFIFFFAVWAKPISGLVFGGLKLRGALNDIPQQNWASAQKKIDQAETHFQRAEDFSHHSKLRFLLFGTEKTLGKISQVGYQAALTAKTSIPLVKQSLTLNQAIFQNEDLNWQETLTELNWRQNQLTFQLNKLQALLNTQWSAIPQRWQDLPNKWQEKLNKANLALNQTSQVTPYLDWVTGANGERRTYLVLLQNNMELRPTGGFIGSFALLTFEDGTLTNFEVKDVYQADGQLKGHVEPPTPIKEILGEANWYLRDSNWNPDFPQSAENAEWFLDKELGREVDGVIGFNLEAAKKLISAFGEINLPDYNETITADNLFERAEYWSEKESFAGSHQKAAFLGVLGQQLFERIKAAEPNEYLNLGQAVWQAIKEKEILTYMNHDQLAQKLNQLNWDGSIRNPSCNQTTCFSDYLFLVEANLGVNKANYFLKRGIEQAIDFKADGQINHTLKINYENTAHSNNWPGGKYTAWLRVYLPLNTQVEKIISYDPLTNTNRKTLSSNQQTANNKQIIGIKVEVPIETKRTIEIDFNQKINNIDSQELGYLLYWQKQSGYRKTPTSILVSYPDSWQPLQVNPAANVVSGKLLFNQQLEKDIKLGIQFGK